MSYRWLKIKLFIDVDKPLFGRQWFDSGVTTITSGKIMLQIVSLFHQLLIF